MNAYYGDKWEQVKTFGDVLPTWCSDLYDAVAVGKFVVMAVITG